MHISELLEIITEDFRPPVACLVPAMLISAAVIVSYVAVYRLWNKKPYPGKRAAAWIFLFSYALVLVQTAFYSREPGSRKGISLTLFETWGNSIQAHAYFVENIIMFFPFGILMPVVFKRMRRVQDCVSAGFLCSCTIELAQLITQRGYCQLDDVVTNTIGTFIGWLAWKCVLDSGKKPRRG